MISRKEGWGGFLGSGVVKNLPASSGDEQHAGLIPGSGVGNGNPLQCSCLEKFHGQRSLAGYSPWVAKSWTQLHDWAHVCTHTQTHAQTHTCKEWGGGHWLAADKKLNCSDSHTCKLSSSGHAARLTPWGQLVRALEPEDRIHPALPGFISHRNNAIINGL